MLHIIGKQHGADIATEVADQMVYNAVREGTATQRVPLQSRHGMRNAHLMRAIALMEASIEPPCRPVSCRNSLEFRRVNLNRCSQGT